MTPRTEQALRYAAVGHQGQVRRGSGVPYVEHVVAVAWILVGTITAARGLTQFARKFQGAHEARQDFYHFYIADRIRGFMSHWMTFSGQELFILLMILSFVLFAPALKKWLWLWLPSVGIVGIALVLSDTRSIWIVNEP